MDRAWLSALADDLARLRARSQQVIVVSSGAVALGRRRLGLSATRRLDEKQAAAAAGQSLLMRAWEEALEPHALAPAQLLLTRDDTEQRRRWLNARATVEALLDMGAVPVINENDTVATEELRYGDNDRLAARAAQLARADVLVLLSDVDGLYTADPRRDPDGAPHPRGRRDRTGDPGHGLRRQRRGRGRNRRHDHQAGSRPHRPRRRLLDDHRQRAPARGRWRRSRPARAPPS